MLAKLQKEASMRLTQMQDIGGCRAVVETIDEVYALRQRYLKSKSLHVLVSEDNYIAYPNLLATESSPRLQISESRAPQYNRLMLSSVADSHAACLGDRGRNGGSVIGQALKSSEVSKLASVLSECSTSA